MSTGTAALERRPYAIAAVSVLAWIGFAAWLIYLLHSQREYESHASARLNAISGIPVYHPGEVIRYDDDIHLLWTGWSAPERGFRWTGKNEADLYFRTVARDDWRCPCALKFHVLYTRGTQHVTVKVLDKTIGSAVISNRGLLAMSIPPGIMPPDAAVRIELILPGAGPPGVNGDNRILGIAVSDFAIVPAK
jgi:hypothetical protein